MKKLILLLLIVPFLWGSCPSEDVSEDEEEVPGNTTGSNITITLNKTTLNLEVDDSEKLTATIRPSTASKTVTWKSSDDKVASVTSGTVIGVGPGTATITATSSADKKKTATCKVTVKEAAGTVKVTLNKTSTSLLVDTTETLTATVTNGTPNTVTWSSADTNIATVADGVITAKAKGSVLITAASVADTKKKASCLVTVVEPGTLAITLDKNTASVVINKTATLTANVLNAVNPGVTWTSTDESVATIAGSGNGKKTGTVSAKKVGTTTIKAASDEDPTQFAECVVTVTPVVVTISLNETEISLDINKTKWLQSSISNATPSTVTWKSDKPAIATVEADGSSGLVTAKAVGEAIITVTSVADTTKFATCKVTVDPPFVDQGLGAKDFTDAAITAQKYFKDHGIFLGWNLGNAFDAVNVTGSIQSPGSVSGGGYGSWTRKIDNTFLPKVKAAGFRLVRLPISWDVPNPGRIGSSPSYTINSALMSEYKEVVDQAYKAGLVVIVNIHHDDKSWLHMANVISGSATAEFTKLWEQIAEAFKDYGDWVIFEPFNEIHNGDWGNSPNQQQHDGINNLNKVFTDTVRAKSKSWSTPQNANRFLVVQGICAKPARVMDTAFKIPTDTATVNKQIISMHYYLPEGFALNGTAASYPDGTFNQSSFGNYRNNFGERPIIFGECGPTYARNGNAANRLKYITEMYGAAKYSSIVPVYWDNGTATNNSDGENFGLWDRQTGSQNLYTSPFNAQAVIDAMVNATK